MQDHKHKSPWLTLGLLICTAALWIWFTQQQQLNEGNLFTKKPAQIDYFIENFRANFYTDAGVLNYALSGDRLTHYQDSDRVTIAKPALIINENNQWLLTSENATGNENFSGEFSFQGNAKITNTDEEDFFIAADLFIFDTVNKTFNAKNAQASVEIVWSKGKVTGNNMVIDLGDNTFSLEQVVGRYEN